MNFIKPISKNAAEKWTPVTDECYERGCVCSGCIQDGLLEIGHCRAKSVVFELIRQAKYPEKRRKEVLSD